MINKKILLGSLVIGTLIGSAVTLSLPKVFGDDAVLHVETAVQHSSSNPPSQSQNVVTNTPPPNDPQPTPSPAPIPTLKPTIKPCPTPGQ